MKKFYIFALMATMFAACTTDGVQEPSATIEDLAPETLTVSFEGEESRIQLQEGKTVWNEGDLVSVFYRSNANQKWQFQGATGDRTGNLKRVEMGTATETMNCVVVVYPYAESYYINPETYNVEASLPATQTYVADSYGVGGNIMVSYGEYNQVVLKSVCGWLKLELTGNGESIKSITLKGNNGEQVAGQLYINSADATATLASDMGGAEDNGSAGGNLVFEDTILTEVTLNCGDGVTLSSEPTAFYIALPPQTFEKGISLEITAADDSKMTKSTDKEVVIERNHILPMEAFEFDGVREQPNNEIWYTATAKVTPYKTDVFGANIVSNQWDSTTKEGVVTFDGKVTLIGDTAFYECSGLTSVTIPDSVTSIGYNAFWNCTSLTSVTIPDSVISIGEKAFYACTSLTSVTIPDNVISIGKDVFGWCSNLTSVTIPNSITSIGEKAFRLCSNMTSVIIGNSVTSIGVQAFLGCTSLTSVTIPNSVTLIGDWAFQNCSGLTNVTVGDSVTSIGNGAFYACTSLTSITIPDSVTSIGSSAFYNCGSLTSVTIGNGVTSIGMSAFSGCSGLTRVYCKPKTPPAVEVSEYTNRWSAFYENAYGRKLYVPRNSVEAYKAASGWSEYASDIVGYDF